MSLASTTVFEVRPGAGSAVNGGGFVPGSSGTDWSQQSAAQYSVADGVLNGTTTVTSATAGFGADVVGNIAYIAGAWYQIVSRTNATTIVVDRATGSGTNQTINIGGALDGCATAEPLLTAGMTLWIKSGTQTITTAITLANSGDSTNGPITWQGYHVTRGDHDGTRPLITTSTNSIDMISGAGNYRIFDNINWSSTAGTPGNGITSGKSSNLFFWVVSDCKLSGFSTGFMSQNSTYAYIYYLYLINLEITSCTTDAISVAATATIDGCYLHGNSGYGIRVATSANTANTVMRIGVTSSVIYSNGLGGVYVLSTATSNNTSGFLVDVSRSAIVSNTNDGIQHAVANAKHVSLSLESNIVYGNSGYGVNITNTAGVVIVNRNNAYGSNASGARNNLAAGANDVALTADPFTARTGNDFTLNTTAGGGAACRGAGFPGSIAGLAAAGAADAGALQSAATGGTTNILCPPRRVYVSRPATIIRRLPGRVPAAPQPAFASVRRIFPQRAAQIVRRVPTFIPPAPQPILSRTRVRSYPVYSPVTRRSSGAAVLPPPF